MCAAVVTFTFKLLGLAHKHFHNLHLSMPVTAAAMREKQSFVPRCFYIRLELSLPFYTTPTLHYPLFHTVLSHTVHLLYIFTITHLSLFVHLRLFSSLFLQVQQWFVFVLLGKPTSKCLGDRSLLYLRSHLQDAFKCPLNRWVQVVV